MTTSSEIEVALRSSRTRTTVPSRISRTIGSSASEREFHASQSPFTLRHTRLTVSLPTSPPNTLRSARRTPARIGAGKIHTGDQRIGSPRAALIIPQHLALPFRRLAAGSVQPGARHRDLGFPERARQRANPAAMPMARNNCCRIPTFRMPGEPAIARARQSRIKLAANHLLDQSADLPADHVFDRIKPIVEKVGVGLDCRMRKFRLAGNILHGVVSWPALKRR